MHATNFCKLSQGAPLEQPPSNPATNQTTNARTSEVIRISGRNVKRQNSVSLMAEFLPRPPGTRVKVKGNLLSTFGGSFKSLPKLTFQKLDSVVVFQTTLNLLSRFVGLFTGFPALAGGTGVRRRLIANFSRFWLGGRASCTYFQRLASLTQLPMLFTEASILRVLRNSFEATL